MLQYNVFATAPQQRAVISGGNVLAPNSRQDIISNNVSLVNWGIYASLGFGT